MHCTLCGSKDLVTAIVKNSHTTIAICRECDSAYETDSNGKPVLDHDSKDFEYFKNLQKLFKDWDNVTNITPYTLQV